MLSEVPRLSPKDEGYTHPQGKAWERSYHVLGGALLIVYHSWWEMMKLGQ